MKIKYLLSKALVTVGLASTMAGLGGIIYNAAERPQKPESIEKLDSLDAQLAENRRLSGLSDNPILDDMYWTMTKEREMLVSDPQYKQDVAEYASANKVYEERYVWCGYGIANGLILTWIGRSMRRKRESHESNMRA